MQRAASSLFPNLYAREEGAIGALSEVPSDAALNLPGRFCEDPTSDKQY